MFLSHHGVKGQKWYVRRYQNKDGSLTALGRRRLYKNDNTQTRKVEKKYQDDLYEKAYIPAALRINPKKTKAILNNTASKYSKMDDIFLGVLKDGSLLETSDFMPIANEYVDKFAKAAVEDFGIKPKHRQQAVEAMEKYYKKVLLSSY